MPWELTGNSGTNPATNFLGTTDNQPLAIRTNGTERMRFSTDGNVGIGTSTPEARLDVAEGDVVVRKFPTNDTTPSLVRILLSNRSAGGNRAEWALYTAAVGGGFGVDPNAFEIWEYPATRRRFQIRPGGNISVGGDLLIQQFPDNDTTPSLTRLALSNRSAGGNTTTWSLYTAAVGGGFGVNPNGFEIWEYPATRPRLRILPGGNTILAPASGNVGIGTDTPGQKLTVAGMVESTSGGFRFPDGTVQSTAQLRGPQGPQGPQGPPGPAVRTSAVCVSGVPDPFGNRMCDCAGGRVISRVSTPCTVTSDTGACSANSASWQGVEKSGQCCVCAP